MLAAAGKAKGSDVVVKSPPPGQSEYASVQVGEDSYFMRPDSMGVADGVGGWSEVKGANAALYSLKMMHYAHSEFEKYDDLTIIDYTVDDYATVSPKDVLARAYQRVNEDAAREKLLGSTTALIVVLRDNELRVANLGDCGIMVVRGHEAIFRNEEQQHSFNFPYQLGTISKDSPADAQLFTIKVQEGDIVVLGTDGLFDNVFDEEIVDIIGVHTHASKPELSDPQRMTDALLFRAREVAEDNRSASSPFQTRAIQEGFYYQGGKMDDVTVLVGIIRDRVVACFQTFPNVPTMLLAPTFGLAALLVSQLASAKTYFKETFSTSTVPSRWVVSEKRTDFGEWKVSPGKFYADADVSRGLQTSQDARFYAISAPFDSEFDNKDKTLVVQFSAKFEQNIDCGGGYVKVMPKAFDPKEFDGDTIYNLMFGPDICGNSKKIHVIFNYKGQNHLITRTIEPGSDQMTHLYTLVVKPDQTYQVLLDQKEVASGSMLEDWNFLPPKTIPDPAAKKPDDWVDEAEIDDPTDVKPAGWDDIPATIPDPKAVRPEDWDDEMDGEWEAPRIENPDYKGPWLPKRIPNPKYKGPWVHPKIENPEYAADDSIYAYKSAFIGFDLWQVKSGTIFDNIIVTDSVDEAKAFADKTFAKFVDAEKEAKAKLDADEEAKLKADTKKDDGKKEDDKKDDEPATNGGMKFEFEEEVEAKTETKEEVKAEEPKKAETKEEAKKSETGDSHDEL
nr:hypothetical protein HK105_007554 [Polyrhizophydium stewartii]